jgi:hypothetical protein
VALNGVKHIRNEGSGILQKEEVTLSAQCWATIAVVLLSAGLRAVKQAGYNVRIHNPVAAWRMCLCLVTSCPSSQSITVVAIAHQRANRQPFDSMGSMLSQQQRETSHGETAHSQLPDQWQIGLSLASTHGCAIYRTVRRPKIPRERRRFEKVAEEWRISFLPPFVSTQGRALVRSERCRQ